MKIFLDHCIPPRFAEALGALSTVDGSIRVTALRDKFSPTAADEEWLPALATEGGWVVVSGDSRIYRNAQRRKIWEQARLTTFFWQPAWNQQPYWDKAWRMVKWWPVLLKEARAAEQGAGFSIPFRARGQLKRIRN